MATINDITNAASYQGNANLGGGGGFVLDVDTKPVQQLAQYTYLYNKSQFDQRQIDADQKIKEIADLSAYNLTTARAKDRQAVIDAVAKLSDAAAAHAAKGTPKSPKEKINQEVEFQKQIQDAKNTINSGNARGLAYNVHRAAIEAEKGDAAAKAEKIKMLDKQFDETDIHTPIQAIPNFEQDAPKVSAPKVKIVDAQAIGGDNNVEQTAAFFDPDSNWASAVIEGGLMSDYMAPPGPDASELEKQQWAVRSKSKAPNSILADAANVFSTVIKDPAYKKTTVTSGVIDTGGPDQPTEQIDFEAIKQKNPVVGPLVALAQQYNEYATQHNAPDWVIDEKGYKVILPNQQQQKWRIIDISDGIDPTELAYLQKFSEFGGDKVDSKVSHTGEASANYRANINEQGANWRAKLPYLNAKIGSGTGTSKTEYELYPIKKTWEFLQPFIDKKTGQVTNKVVKYSDMTPEQQEKVKAQVIVGGTDRLDPDQLSASTISFIAPTTDHPNGQIKVAGKVKEGDVSKDAVVVINPDDITLDYYNAINKNDAGKEAPQRMIFDFNTDQTKTATPDATTTAEDDKLTDADYFKKYKKVRVKK